MRLHYAGFMSPFPKPSVIVAHAVPEPKSYSIDLSDFCATPGRLSPIKRPCDLHGPAFPRTKAAYVFPSWTCRSTTTQMARPTASRFSSLPKSAASAFAADLPGCHHASLARTRPPFVRSRSDNPALTVRTPEQPSRQRLRGKSRVSKAQQRPRCPAGRAARRKGAGRRPAPGQARIRSTSAANVVAV